MKGIKIISLGICVLFMIVSIGTLLSNIPNSDHRDIPQLTFSIYFTHLQQSLAWTGVVTIPLFIAGISIYKIVQIVND